MRLSLLTVFVLYLVVPVYATDSPQITVDSGAATLLGVTPGHQVAWLGMIRDWEGGVARVRFVRGLAAATEQLSLASGMDLSRSIWAAAGIDEPFSLVVSPVDFRAAAGTVEIQAVAGAAQIAIRGAAIHGTYVRPHGAAWAFFAGDGEEMDADGEVNGWIVLSLDVLSRFEGNPPPPETVLAGDVILAMDTVRLRGSAAEVQP